MHIAATIFRDAIVLSVSMVASAAVKLTPLRAQHVWMLMSIPTGARVYCHSEMFRLLSLAMFGMHKQFLALAATPIYEEPRNTPRFRWPSSGSDPWYRSYSAHANNRCGPGTCRIVPDTLDHRPNVFQEASGT